MLPMSSRRIIRLFQGHVAADDPFQMPVLGAQEQRAVFVQRFGLAVDRAVAHANRNTLARGWRIVAPIRRRRLAKLAAAKPS